MTHASNQKAPTRRPMKTRTAGWARWMATQLASTKVTPNQISGAGLVMAILAGLAFGLVPSAGTALTPFLLIGGATLIGLRLLCNMLDGLVAVEGGKASPTGPLWNELPDRLADMAILVGAGFAAGSPSLGWAAAALAVLTAYIRVTGEHLAGRADFSGPLAKPQRMAVLVGAALGASGWPAFASEILELALIALTAGTAITAALRCHRVFGWLSQPNDKVGFKM